jgi:hypothetical protein
MISTVRMIIGRDMAAGRFEASSDGSKFEKYNWEGVTPLKLVLKVMTGLCARGHPP